MYVNGNKADKIPDQSDPHKRQNSTSYFKNKKKYNTLEIFPKNKNLYELIMKSPDL